VDVERIRGSTAWRAQRIEFYESQDGPVVVKGQRPRRTPLGDRILALMARLAGVPLLCPVPAPGGAEGQAIEVRRLREMRQAGIGVPRVLHEDDEFFVMERFDGPNLAQALETDPAEALPLWRQGLQTVLAAHRCGQYFAQAYARNFIVTLHGLRAVDFESDPLQTMPLAQAQARDWLLYLQATVWRLCPGRRRGAEAPLTALVGTWERDAGAESGPVLEQLQAAASRLDWLRFLPRSRRLWGRDVVGVQGAAAFLHAWRKPRRST
jgi:tRNA A-37 threonylcarbamoyl transferase component Bud32